MTHPSEIVFFTNSMTYFLCSSSYNPSLIQKILFKLKLHTQGSIEQDYLSKYVKKFGSDKKIYFSNESVKKPSIYDLLFIIAIYSLQNVNKQSSEMKNKLQNSRFTTSTVFLALESILYAGQKLWLTAKFFWKLFLIVDCPIKELKVSEAQSNRFIFRR